MEKYCRVISLLIILRFEPKKCDSKLAKIISIPSFPRSFAKSMNDERSKVKQIILKSVLIACHIFITKSIDREKHEKKNYIKTQRIIFIFSIMYLIYHISFTII